MKERASSHKLFVILGIICLATIGIFKLSLSYNFTYLDDQVQIVNNLTIRELSLDKLSEIFSSTSVGMYQPISTFFYAITFAFAGLNPTSFHLLSLVFHLINTVLIYLVLSQFNTNQSVALILTAVFATHPMQVESVAWISAFSNLCFTSFLLLAFLSYLSFSKNQKKHYYILSLTLFLIAGLAKSSAVIFPLILIAYDFIVLKKKIIKSVISKTPFFIISISLGIVTILSRETAGHLSDLSINFTWFDRIFLISHSVLFYPLKFIAPLNLSAFYAYPEINNGLLPLSYYLSPLALFAIAFLIWKVKPNRIVLFGLAFYLIGVALVLQFIPVGNQLTTDRYLYIPMLGFLLIICYYLNQIKNQKLIPFFFIIPFALAILSIERTKIWENDKTIWTDVISKNPTVAQAYNNLGSYVLQEKNSTLAMQHFNKAIQLKPYYADAYSNRGSLYADIGNSAQAMKDLNQAIKLRPHADAYYNRANEFVKQKDLTSAIADYSESIKLKPSPDAYTNRAFVFAQMRNTEKALKDLNKALMLNSNYGQAYFLKGMIYNGQGKKNQACFELNKASNLNHTKAKQALQQFCN